MLHRHRLVMVLFVLVSVLAAPVQAIAAERPTEPARSASDSVTELTRTVSVVKFGEIGDPPRVVRTERAGGIPTSFEAVPAALSASVTTVTDTCFYAQPTYYTYNGFGLATTSWYYMEWCGSGGVVTSVLTLYCGGSASNGWEYTGCSVNRGSTGFSFVNVNGSWSYRSGCCGFYVYRYVSVAAKHYHTGVIAGQWTAE